MNLKKWTGVVAIATFSSVLAVFVYSKFIDKTPMYVVQEARPTRLTGLSDTNNPLDFTYAADKTIHAVVHVKTKSVQTYSNANPFYDFFYGDQVRRPVMGFGSGVIISPDGYIVTNNHVIDKSDEISVTLNDKREFVAKLVGTDPSTDLAVLKINAKDLLWIPFGSSEDLKVGEWVLAVGNPFNLTSTVTAGIVSAKARNLQILPEQYKIESFIQTDAALNSGNSGGALVNTNAELVGINTAIISPNGAYSGNSFAIPSTIVKKVVEDLKEFGTVQRAILGVSINDVDANMARDKGLDKIVGVNIADLKADGAAGEAGLKAGDIIVKVNDREVNNTAELQEQISKYRPKDKIKITAIRNGDYKVFDVQLKNMEGTTEIVKTPSVVSKLGASLSSITDKEKQKLGIKNGVKVTEVSNGKFMRAGIEEGFIIISINNKPVNTPGEVENIISATRGGIFIEGVYPDGSSSYYAFGM